MGGSSRSSTPAKAKRPLGVAGQVAEKQNGLIEAFHGSMFEENLYTKRIIFEHATDGSDFWFLFPSTAL